MKKDGACRPFFLPRGTPDAHPLGLPNAQAMTQQQFSFHAVRLQPACALSVRPAGGRARRRAGALGPLFAAGLLLLQPPIPAQAQVQPEPEPVYRCGRTYTNAPPAGQLCERLPEQRVTVIEGTRVRRPPAPTASAAGAADAAADSGTDAALRDATTKLTTGPAKPAVPTASTLRPEAQGAMQPEGQGDHHRQAVRQAQARAVLLDELARTRERHTQLQRELASLQTPVAEPARAQALQQQLARSQRDLQSLQRELDRFHPEGRR